MKSLWSFLVARPWLLVVLAFVLLIFGWALTIRLSAGVPTGRLTPEQEAAILQGRAGGR
ncbi:MAG: hypothetical protein IAE94_07425 [Chthoniobacterales bacterium]|nr:hypothetical protein [Chthoniobacterales bacterium]